MRALLPLALAAALSGCATHRAPVAQKPGPLKDWATVLTIPVGTSVRATFGRDSVIEGSLSDVTHSKLTIRREDNLLMIDRAQVVRVEASEPVRRHAWLEKPLAVGIVGGLAGMLVGAVTRNGKAASISFGVFVGSSAAAIDRLFTSPIDYVMRVVYVRP